MSCDFWKKFEFQIDLEETVEHIGDLFTHVRDTNNGDYFTCN